MPIKNSQIPTGTSTNSQRHIIAHNAHELALKEPKLFEATLNKIAPKSNWQFSYAGDENFKKYFRGEFEQVSRMIEFYEKPEAFVASMNSEDHFKRAELLVRKILWSIPADSHSLIFATLDAYSLTLAALLLRELGAQNVVLNFLSSPTINGSTKSFEAYLLLLAHNASEGLRTLTSKSAKTLQKEFTAISGNMHSYYLEEDETLPPYQLRSLPESIRAQIGQKASRMVYRLGLTPDRAYMEGAKISHLILCDASGELGPSAMALMAVAEELGPSKLRLIKVSTHFAQTPFEAGIYEKYLTREAINYLHAQESYTHNSDLLHTQDLSNKKSSRQKTSSTLSGVKSISDQAKAIEIAQEKRSLTLLYLGVIPLLVLGMVVTLGTPTKTTNWSVGSKNWWNSNWSNGGSNGGSWSSNASKNASSVSKSFGGGGFSRGGGSSKGGGG